MTRRPKSEPLGRLGAPSDAYIVAEKADVSGLRRRVRAELNECGAPPSESFDCLVALTEACTNALLHGRTTDDALPPKVAWKIDSQAARFFVKDFSNLRWSIAAHPSTRLVDFTESDAGTRIGGFGLDLMQRLMDEVEIAIEPQGTTVRLVKFFTSPIS
jgi:anti-sigma regulatory factor (Ser/Thr protein kinase)